MYDDYVGPLNHNCAAEIHMQCVGTAGSGRINY